MIKEVVMPPEAATTVRPERTVSEPIFNPTRLDKPAFLMNCPFSLSADVPNNLWMEDLLPPDRTIDMKKAMVQFLEVYRFFAAEAVVYMLPTPRGCRLQDLVYTANLGIVLDHLPDKNTVVISNFTSQPRRGEAKVGIAFFEAMGYDVHVPPTRFEGEAELKHLHDNVYIGGYGLRSERETYDWMERVFDMRIIKVNMCEPYLYHLDCSIFPITPQSTLVCTELFEPSEVAAIEKETDIIDVSADICFNGICNSVRLTNTITNSSHIHDLRAGTEAYQQEIAKNRKLEDIASSLAFEVTYFNLSEYHKSGALLSCMVMHLNRHSYAFTLL
jgi:N-dimethylarginine dimethylaminohydrolase